MQSAANRSNADHRTDEATGPNLAAYSVHWNGIARIKNTDSSVNKRTVSLCYQRSFLFYCMGALYNYRENFN